MAATATSASTPWSGNWWPYKESGRANLYDAGGPLAKYDQYVRNTRGYNPGAQAHEAANFATGDEASNWWGHCQGLVAASMLAPEPPAGGVEAGGVSFSQEDLEGLLSDVYTDPEYDWLSGVRAETDDPRDPAFKDINPAWMDYLLRYYITQHKHPIAMDIGAGSQVWNYPAHSFERDVTDNPDGSKNVRTTVWFSDAAAGVAGTKSFSRTYDYQLWNTGDGHSDGRWLGESVERHPDFAWVPTGRGEGHNPGVDPEIVSEIIGRDV